MQGSAASSEGAVACELVTPMPARVEAAPTPLAVSVLPDAPPAPSAALRRLDDSLARLDDEDGWGGGAPVAERLLSEPLLAPAPAVFVPPAMPAVSSRLQAAALVLAALLGAAAAVTAVARFRPAAGSSKDADATPAVAAQSRVSSADATDVNQATAAAPAAEPPPVRGAVLWARKEPREDAERVGVGRSKPLWVRREEDARPRPAAARAGPPAAGFADDNAEELRLK